MFHQLLMVEATDDVRYLQATNNVDNIPSAVAVKGTNDMNMFRQGFRLNLMVVGEEGLGKASLVNSLFKANAQSCSAPLVRVWNTLRVLVST
jgi:septin family protein